MKLRSRLILVNNFYFQTTPRTFQIPQKSTRVDIISKSLSYGQRNVTLNVMKSHRMMHFRYCIDITISETSLEEDKMHPTIPVETGVSVKQQQQKY